MAADNPVTVTSNRERALNPEWVLIYRNGLPRCRIAELASFPAHTVSYHLRLARRGSGPGSSSDIPRCPSAQTAILRPRADGRIP